MLDSLQVRPHVNGRSAFSPRQQKSNEIAIAEITVAAIIPLYNGAPFIAEALKSVFEQTMLPDEVIVVDDGSKDNGADIVRELSHQFPIRLISRQNGGQSAARNTGIGEAKSSHIALLDQDDIWLPHHISSLADPFLKQKNRRLGWVYGNLDRIDRNGRLLCHNFLDEFPTSHPKKSVLQCISQDMFILPGAALFTKEAWQAVGGFDERLSGYEDDDFFLRLLTAGYENEYLAKTNVSQWRVYDGSCSYTERMAASRMIYFNKLKEAYPDEPRLNLYWGRDAFAPRILGSVFHDLMRCSRSGDNAGVLKLWKDMRTIAPVLRRGQRRRLRILGPLITGLFAAGLQKCARKLVRFSLRHSA